MVYFSSLFEEQSTNAGKSNRRVFEQLVTAHHGKLLVLNSLYLFTLTRIPAREWCHSEWMGLSTSITIFKIVSHSHG